MSNGVPPSAAAASASSAKANRASGSTKRRISQAQAVRSMWGCGLVTHSMESSLPPRLDSELTRLEDLDRVGHGRRRGSATAGPEIIPSPFQSEGALESAELAERLTQRGSIFGPRLPAATPPTQPRVSDAGRRCRDLGVPPVRVAAEQVDQRSILGGGSARLPDPRGPALLLDLFREPVERLTRFG